VLAIYIVVGIPLINNYLLPLVIDFVNNYGLTLVVNYTTIRYVWNETGKTFQQIPEVITLDLRGLVVFIVQLVVYIGLPLFVVFKVVRSK